MTETTETVQPVDLEAAREICENAEMGPWSTGSAVEDQWQLNGCDGKTLLELGSEGPEFGHESNAAFCAAARTLLPQALDEIGRLRETVAYLTRAFRANAGYKPEGKL
jgi:hypothetical protein